MCVCVSPHGMVSVGVMCPPARTCALFLYTPPTALVSFIPSLPLSFLLLSILFSSSSPSSPSSSFFSSPTLPVKVLYSPRPSHFHSLLRSFIPWYGLLRARPRVQAPVSASCPASIAAVRTMGRKTHPNHRPLLLRSSDQGTIVECQRATA